ncbi:hypothetical protein Desdi_2841 [Desulfitobacterium dichloroeliminans LMG P-21439]|uniref:Uncharacterized protein n=1 Tax=Desulfitobacterium dichloroeliminans (strain LMG P-21439 / DCA1) TaxID=871963 RepID=L0FBC6_DESDL|nr:hypothetical protein [Desulfitobacterium dichloroeliminans]AGA70253.1 hypothetical protein Desdi_2841 [Desulfitobacterium dichloroeliminans LMG P-21439]
MGEYYNYLWKATWIEALGILLLGIFILLRTIWKFYSVAQKEMKLTAKLLLVFRGFGWLTIFTAYLLMFQASEPDWFARPVVVQGGIQGKSMVSDTLHPYSVEIEWESGRETLHVDLYTYQALEPGKRVNMTFLPHRLEVIACEILPPVKEKKEDGVKLGQGNGGKL